MGDICPGGVLTFSGGVSSEVIEYLDKFDIRVATLESAIGDGSVKCHVKMSDPSLGNIIYSPDGSISILKRLNIDAVSIANNHVCDLDLAGLRHTIELLDANGIAHFGAGVNKEEAEKPAFIYTKGYKVCLLSYFPPNWEASYPPSENEGGLNHFNIDKVLDDIKKYKSLCDYLFVMPHWGLEYSRFPYVKDLENAKRMIMSGADGVVGSHTHIVQPMIKYRGKIIATSLGNFLFPDRYIVPPRQTYYPNKDFFVMGGGISVPITYGFPIVTTLTLKIIKPVARIGVICTVTLDGSSQSFRKRFTLLNSENWLRLYNESKFIRAKLFAIGIIMKSSFCYKVYNKFIQILRRTNKKLNKIWS